MVASGVGCTGRVGGENKIFWHNVYIVLTFEL